MGKNNEKNRIIIIIVVLIAILTLLGGTLAFWSWQTGNDDKTNVVFTLTSTFWCAADGGGSISSATLMPASCTNETYAIQREVKLTSSIEADDVNINMDLWLNIDQIGDGLSQSEHFKYALTTNPNSCTEGVVKSGTFHNLEANDKAMLLEQKEYGSSMEDTLYLYIWIDPEETNHMIVDQTFSFSLGGECMQIEPYKDSILNGADPVLSTGMIPVTIANNGTVTTADIKSEWYNYGDKEWANVVLVSDESRSSYYESDGVTIKDGETIPEDNILAYYVWIPRYSYRINEPKCSDFVEHGSHSECYKTNIADIEELANWWSGYAYEWYYEKYGLTYDDAYEDIMTAYETGRTIYYEGGVYLNFASIIMEYEDDTGYEMDYSMEFMPDNVVHTPYAIDISFEGSSQPMLLGDAVTTYRTHPAFWWDNNNNNNVDSGEMLSGIWVAKFETSHKSNDANQAANYSPGCTNSNCTSADNLRIKPNVVALQSCGLNNYATYGIKGPFYEARSIERTGNPFGLVSTEVDTHVMKNSEWGAVTYLSHSLFGINDRVRLNNSWQNTTGCGASSDGASVVTYCDIRYGSLSEGGVFPQSTSGNITGIFDMSGGAHESVMAFNVSSSGSDFGSLQTFIPSIGSKYWDNYSSLSIMTACNGGICKGHALSETSGWYGNSGNFISHVLDPDDGQLDYFPILYRGGYNWGQINSGLFNFDTIYEHSQGTGGTSFSNNYRLVITGID